MIFNIKKIFYVFIISSGAISIYMSLQGGVLQSEMRTIGNRKIYHMRLKYKEGLPKLTGPTPVIILTYMRSGSTFTGDILQSHPGVFYLFEPLNSLTNKIMAMKNKRSISLLEESTNNVHNLLKCSFKYVTSAIINHGFMSMSKTSVIYPRCLHNKTTHKRYWKRACVDKLERRCVTSSHVIIKTIRFPMFLVQKLMLRMPNLRIIHLIRDPRPTLYSAKRFGWTPGDTELFAKRFCNEIYSDIMIAKQINAKYKNRILTVLYEHLATHTLSTVKEMFTFLGIPFTEHIKEHVHKLTSTGKSNKCGGLCTKKANSSKEAYDWRFKVEYEFVHLLDAACSLVYNELGYKLVRDKYHLLNISDQLWS